MTTGTRDGREAITLTVTDILLPERNAKYTTQRLYHFTFVFNYTFCL